MEAIPDNLQLIDVFGPPSYNNLDDPKPFTNEPGTLIGFTASFLILSWIFVCLRLYARLFIVRMPGWDDVLVSLYLVFTSIASIIFLSSISFGAGQHFLLLTFGQVKKYLELFYVMNINLNLSAMFIKLSLLVQFLRLFEKGTWAYRASIAGIITVTLWSIAFIILAIFPCSYIPDAWNILSQDAHCWGYASQVPEQFTATLVSHNTINTFFDIYITLIPVQLYFKPGVTLRTRLGLMILILMGATVVTLSAWRIYETIYYQGGFVPTHDPTWYGPKSILLMVLEINVASICASVPIFWPVFGPYLGAIFVTHEFSVKYEARESISSRGRGDSETGLNSHYKDTFVMDLVNPLSNMNESRVEGGTRKGNGRSAV